MKLFERVVRLTVDGVQIEQLRVSFKIKKTLSKEPNDCEVTVYNLAKENRVRFQKKGAHVVLEAGYKDSLGQIFNGDSRVASSAQMGPDWVTKILLGDGERAYRYSNVSESFRPGTPTADVFARIANGMGLDAASAVGLAKDAITGIFRNGFTASGRSSDVVDKLLKSHNLSWSIQDGRLQVLGEDEYSGLTRVDLSPTTGLVGSPEYGTPPKNSPTKPRKPPLLKVKSLLQATIRPGCKIRVESENVKGDFRVEQVEHTGDTHGNEWYSESEVIQLKHP